MPGVRGTAVRGPAVRGPITDAAQRLTDRRTAARACINCEMSDRLPTRRQPAFAPSTPPTPRCPVCWSKPFLGPTRQVRRGWRVQASEAEATGGTTVTVASTIYPCSNPVCDSAIVMRMALTGGYLQSDLDEGLLRDAAAAAYLRGRTGRDGLWRDRSGDPKTAPVQRDLFG